MSTGLATPLSLFGQNPPEGMVATPVTFNFGGANNPRQSSDLVIGAARGFMTQCRTVFIDNSQSPAILSLSFLNGNTITVPPFSQGYYPVLVPSIQFNISCLTGAAAFQVTVWLINILLPAVFWTSQGLPVIIEKIGAVDTLMPNFQPNDAICGDITNTTAVLSPAQGYVLSAADFSLSLGATIAAAGDLVISLVDSFAGVIWKKRVFVPNVAAIGNAPQIVQFKTPGNFFFSSKQNAATLTIQFSTPLTAGQLTYALNWMLTSYIGA